VYCITVSVDFFLPSVSPGITHSVNPLWVCDPGEGPRAMIAVPVEGLFRDQAIFVLGSHIFGGVLMKNGDFGVARGIGSCFL